MNVYFCSRQESGEHSFEQSQLSLTNALGPQPKQDTQITWKAQVKSDACQDGKVEVVLAFKGISTNKVVNETIQI